MKNLRKIICVLLLGTMLLSLGACGQADTGNNQADRHLELVDSPSTTLDNVWYNPGGIFRCAIFESLVIANAQMTEITPALAESYELSVDGCSYTFKLRDDVTWHDGEKFGPEDVVFSIKTALRSEEINGIISSAFQFIEGAENYSQKLTEDLPGVVVDGNQVTIRLTTPIGDFLEVMAQFAILPEHLLANVAPELLSEADYWKNPVGCGAYKITEAKEGEYFILEANKDYYGKEASIKKIRLRLESENSVEEMKNGTLDFYVTNDPEEIAQLKGMDNCSEHDLNILFPAYFILNLSEDEGTNPYLKDVRVREALLLAIDRKSIVEVVFPGSKVTDTMVPSWDSYYWTEAKTYDFNPERAKALLEEAGYDFSQPIRLRYFTKGQSTADFMNAVAVYWRAIGLQVDLEMFEGSGSDHMFNLRDYDICYKRLSAFDHLAIYGEVQGDGVMQQNLLNQPIYDELLNKLEAESNLEARKAIIQEMQKLDQEFLLRLPLFSLANVAYVANDNFSMPDAYGNLWYRYDLCFDQWKLVNE